MAMRFDPEGTLRCAAELDTLAHRLEVDMTARQTVLTVPPAGRDEVSVRAATTLCHVATAYREAVDLGIQEVRAVASVLRTHTSQLVEMDDSNAIVLESAR
ncbi:PE family protein [Nocardia flavorosea]|uniref:PE family protein n=1 Tax=Nocardia flavorosea TaxID=53429 RepID=UPI003CC7CED0